MNDGPKAKPAKAKPTQAEPGQAASTHRDGEKAGPAKPGKPGGGEPSAGGRPKPDGPVAPAPSGPSILAPRHLRVAVRVGEGGAAVESVWLAPTPLTQVPELPHPIWALVRVQGIPDFVQDLPDPRVLRGIYQEKVGHAYSSAPSGVVVVSVPFAEAAALSTLRIRLLDTAGSRLRRRDARSAIEAFDAGGGTRLGEVSAAQVMAHPEWPAVARAIGLPAIEGRFEVYKDRSGEHRWRLVRNNGEVVADSGEGYPTRAELEEDLRWIRRVAASVPVQDLTGQRP